MKDFGQIVSSQMAYMWFQAIWVMMTLKLGQGQ
jgi:hypothetical protein